MQQFRFPVLSVRMCKWMEDYSQKSKTDLRGNRRNSISIIGHCVYSSIEKSEGKVAVSVIHTALISVT